MKKKRFIIEVNDEWHQKVKIHTVERNISIRAWIMQAIVALVKQEEELKKQ